MVNNRSCAAGGSQTIVTPDPCVIQIAIENGLPIIKMRLFTDREWGALPHVIMTSDLNWDPKTLDYRMQCFMYSVFQKTIKTTKGQDLVKNFKRSTDLEGIE
jgi:hypothetical protein